MLTALASPPWERRIILLLHSVRVWWGWSYLKDYLKKTNRRMWHQFTVLCLFLLLDFILNHKPNCLQLLCKDISIVLLLLHTIDNNISGQKNGWFADEASRTWILKIRYDLKMGMRVCISICKSEWLDGPSEKTGTKILNNWQK